MDKALLIADIETANQEIRDAEKELKQIVKQLPVAPRASKVKVSEVVKTASARLSAARANLIRLNARLADLVEIEATAALAKLEEAKAAILEAEVHLDRVVRGMTVDADAEKSWVPQEVQDAFSNLERAKKRLADLQALAKKET